MDRTVMYGRPTSLLSKDYVLRNTYCLLALTLAFSTVIAYLTSIGIFPSLHPMWSLLIIPVLLFWVEKTADQSQGLIPVFALTGYLGYTVGPLCGLLLRFGYGHTLLVALAGTALIFFSLSAYVLQVQRIPSMLESFFYSSGMTLFFLCVLNLFLRLSYLEFLISGLCVPFASSAIMYHTHAIIDKREQSYIRATVSLYLALYNLFVSLVQLIMLTSGSRDNRRS